MNDITAIDELICIDDGDSIIAGMGVLLPQGQTQYYGNTQYYDPASYACTPDFSLNKIGFYPNNYSSAGGVYVIPDGGYSTWYLNNVSTANILAQMSNGVLTISDKTWGTVNGVSLKYSDIFEVGSYEIESGKSVPCIYIKRNLPPVSLTDINIYCVATYNGLSITSRGSVEIKPANDNSFQVIIVSKNKANNTEDSAINTATEKIILHAEFQKNGVIVNTGDDVCAWEKLNADGTYTTVQNNLNDLEIGEADVNGTAEYCAKVIHNNVTYRAFRSLSDTQDPFYINMGRSVNGDSSAGPTIRKTDIVTYTPTVIVRSTGSSSNGWSYGFSAYGANNPTATFKTSSASPFTIYGTEVNSHGGAHIVITASKSTQTA